MKLCGIRNAEFGSKGTTGIRAPRSPVRNAPGFTLLEVMVAVAILALVVVSLLGLRNRSLQDVQLAERITTATMLAQRVMTDTLLAKALLPDEQEGTFEEEAFKDYAWKKVVAPSPVPSIMDVRVAVAWTDGDRTEQVELVSYE